VSAKIKLNRYSKKELIEFAKIPGTSQFAFSERSGGYVIGRATTSALPLNVTAKTHKQITSSTARSPSESAVATPGRG